MREVLGESDMVGEEKRTRAEGGFKEYRVRGGVESVKVVPDRGGEGESPGPGDIGEGGAGRVEDTGRTTLTTGPVTVVLRLLRRGGWRVPTEVGMRPPNCAKHLKQLGGAVIRHSSSSNSPSRR